MTPTTTTTTPANPDTLTSAEFGALFRWLRTAKGPLRSYAMPLRPQSAGNRFANLKLEPTLETAAWKPERNAKSGHTWHQISIGEKAPATMPAKARSTKARRQAAMRALLRHECAHIAHSATDFATTLVPLMRRANVPFALFNLMEDARIEALMVATTGAPFDWRTHMSAPPATTDNPTAFFYSLVYHESALSGARWTGTSPADAAWIREHYTRTTDPAQTPNSAGALARAFEFAQRFSLSAIELPPHRNPAAPDGTADPTHIPEPAPDAAETLAGAAPTHAAGATADTTNAAPHSTGGTPEDIQTALLRDLPAAFLQFARRPSERAPELGDAKRTAAELSAMARRAGVSPSRLAQSGSRIHCPAIAIGAESAFRRPSPDRGPRRLCLILDMSGSMAYTFRDHAAAFAAAALELNRSRALQVDVWLSQSGAAAKLPAATRCEALQTLGANGGGEGLSNCMRLAAADMAAASAVVVYTDGELGEDKLPRRCNGADIIGAVCAPDHRAAKMQQTLRQHFDRALVSGTPHSLAREIVRYVLTRP
jgi:hypothetical protein